MHSKISVENIEELMDMWKIDCPVDKTEIAQENTRIPVLHQKYLSIEKTHTLIVRKMEAEYARKKLWYWRYYMGKPVSQEEIEQYQPEISPNESILKSNIDGYLAGEETLNKIWLAKETHKEIADYAKNIVWQLKDRTTQLQTILGENKHRAGN